MREKVIAAIQDFENFLNGKQPDMQCIIDYLRPTPLPYLASYTNELSRAERLRYSFDYLYTLGKYNLPLAVGLCMNQYICLSISCIPISIQSLQNDLLAKIRTQQWIAAVSSFDDFIRHKDQKANLVRCQAQADGSFVCNGVKNFQSNISVADVLFFSAVLDNGDTAFFYVYLKDQPGILLGKPIYTGAMADADTRSVTFADVPLTPENLIPVTDQGQLFSIHSMTRVLFSVLAMAPYLGGAMRALEEVSAFLNNVHLEGLALATLDGYQTDVGRAKIKYQICESMIERFIFSIDTLNENNFSSWLKAETPKAHALKYHISAVCEELVNFSRKVIGTRAMVPSHIVGKLSQQVQFGPLHPVVNAKIEREFGNTFLNPREPASPDL